MPVALRSHTNAATTAPGDRVLLSKPAGLANGDLLTLIVARMTEDATATSVTWSCAGFTQLPGFSPGGSATIGGALLYKFVTDAAGEPASYEVVATRAVAGTLHLAGGAAAWSGVHQSTPFDVAAASQYQLSQTVTAPSLTTVTSDCLLVFHGKNRRLVGYTPPAGMTEVWENASSGGTATNVVSNELAIQQIGSAGATGVRSAEISGGANRENIGSLVALRPATPAGLSVRTRVGGVWVSGTPRRIA